MMLPTHALANPVPASMALARAQAAKDDPITTSTTGLNQPADLNVLKLSPVANRPECFYWAPDGEQLLGIYRTIAVELPCPGVHFWGQP